MVREVGVRVREEGVMVRKEGVMVRLEGVMVRVEGVMVRCQCQGGRYHGQGHGQGGVMSGRSMGDLRARGVVVSHPLSMRGALGSNPSESTLACYTAFWVHQNAIKDDVWEGQVVKWE